MDFVEEIHCVESDAETYDLDDTQNDPDFDMLEDTKLQFSNISISKKTKPRVCISNESDGEEAGSIEIDETELDENDQKSYEKVQSMIQAGEVEKLKVDQCKIYLRKHKLRLTGNKATLIQRIKEHIDIVNGGGEKKYPVSSFVLNCKGDACTGDVVFFEQNVYEMFSIASRSANGPPCGTRIVAGRIVKESYGMAKQQHTFTIEVLWSKGEKPLPALHPLLIKGRNLYRLKTMRQRWEDEGVRQKILSEKHTRGCVARANREARVEKKKMRQELKLNRVKTQCHKQAAVGENEETRTNKPEKHDKNGTMLKNKQEQTPLENEGENSLPKPLYRGPSTLGVSSMPSQHDRLHRPLPYANVINGQCGSKQPLNGQHSQRQPLSDANLNTLGNYSSSYKPGRMWHGNRINQSNQAGSYYFTPAPPPLHSWNLGYDGNPYPARGSQSMKQQPCWHYAQGRCHYGHNCKYLH
ncbi:unnamed protein product [Cuscuta epithymum]|uniref:C3H1-type domain-containing protein n=1 Tax=Cuscuta epithymum TaxID=186058 RepID=A0AAV0DG06_9ASTE|nr:unnamed protein product [Cuscuta epithymum]